MNFWQKDMKTYLSKFIRHLHAKEEDFFDKLFIDSHSLVIYFVSYLFFFLVNLVLNEALPIEGFSYPPS